MSIDTPDWVRDAVFNQIFPDRFGVNAGTEPSELRVIAPSLAAARLFDVALPGRSVAAPVMVGADGHTTLSLPARTGRLLVRG